MVHDQAAKLREAVGDVPDPEDSIDYGGLKASVGQLTRLAIDTNAPPGLIDYMIDVCSVHDIEIPEDDDD